MLRAFLAASVLIAAPTAPEVLPVSVVDTSAIVQVVCYGPGYISSGTAFRVGNGLILSVNHVTSSGQCFIAGKPIRLAYKAQSDFSMLHGDSGAFLKVDCGGFIKGRRYVAAGFARGLPQLTYVELVALGQNDPRNGEALLAGIFAVVPGQSGGPLIDEQTGRVVGVVNAEDFEDGISWSVPLSSTPVCQQRIA